MGKKKGVPNRQQAKVKRENKFIDMPKDKLIKICVIVGLVIVAIVLFFVLRRAYDGHLPVQEGVVVTEADNWIVANTESAGSPRYFKLGTAGEVEGYTRSRDETLVSDANTAPFTYKPEDETSAIDSATVMVGGGAYDTLAANVHANYGTYMTGAQVGEMDESDVGGTPARSFAISYSYENPAAEGAQGEDGAQTQASTVYVRGHYIYLRAGHDRSVIVSVSSQAGEEATLASEELLKTEALKIAAQVTID